MKSTAKIHENLSLIDLPNEIWKDIPNCKNYQASNLGRIKSLFKHNNTDFRILRQHPNKNGYIYIILHIYKNKKAFRVHQLVAMAFLDHKPCGNQLVINHKNFDKSDNRLENLEIVTNRINSNKKHLNSSSEYTGVYRKYKNKWGAKIRHNNKQYYLGSFDNEVEASLRYEKALADINQNTFKKN